MCFNGIDSRPVLPAAGKFGQYNADYVFPMHRSCSCLQEYYKEEARYTIGPPHSPVSTPAHASPNTTHHNTAPTLTSIPEQDAAAAAARSSASSGPAPSATATSPPAAAPVQAATAPAAPADPEPVQAAPEPVHAAAEPVHSEVTHEKAVAAAVEEEPAPSPPPSSGAYSSSYPSSELLRGCRKTVK